jgi:hypothetical protein
VKAFGGVLNGLDGNFGPAQRGQKMNARVNQLWRFPFAEETANTKGMKVTEEVTGKQ